jgi:hypothetical protein
VRGNAFEKKSEKEFKVWKKDRKFWNKIETAKIWKFWNKIETSKVWNKIERWKIDRRLMFSLK